MLLREETVFAALYGVFAVAVLLVVVLLLRWERGDFARRGLARSWRTMRRATVPIALATVAAVVIPTRRVSGMEALAVFYGLLFTLAPLTWFGLHALVARMARPALPRGDWLQLATLPIGFAIAVALAATQLQPAAWALARTAQSASLASATDADAPYALLETRRYVARRGDALMASWRATPGVVVERIDFSTGTQLIPDAVQRMRSFLCLEPDGIRMLLPATMAGATLQIYWRDADGGLRRSVLAMPAAPATATPFTVRFDGPDTITLPERLPRATLWTGRRDPTGHIAIVESEAQSFQPGERVDHGCLGPTWTATQPVDGVGVRVDTLTGGDPLWLEATRDDAPAPDS